MNSPDSTPAAGAFQSLDLLILSDAAAWRAWLDTYEHDSTGVRLALAKKGTTLPTSLTYAQALEEALCSGWIDGRRNAIDEHIFQQHFTPRRKTSIWSQRNVTIVGTLISQGRMRPRGQVEIERAQADGRWERAYTGQSIAEVPGELAAALAQSPTATVHFSTLTRAERYTAIHQVMTAATAKTKANRIAKFIAKWELAAVSSPDDQIPR